MQNLIKIISLTITMALFAVTASAQEGTTPAPEELTGSANYQVVQAMLAEDATMEQIIATLEEKMSRSEATVFCLVAAGQENRQACIEAGIDGAASYAEARAVAMAVLATVGANSPEAALVQKRLTEFTKTMDQPTTYSDDYSPYGGGTSPDV